MTVSFVLIILLIGAIVTFLSNDKFAPKITLFFSLAALVLSVLLLQSFSALAPVTLVYPWIGMPNISFALQLDGLSLAMLLLTTGLGSIIILSSFGTTIKNAKAFYSLVLFMLFAMAGTFLAADGLLYYVFWELSLLPIYFIALLWGEGEDLKKAVVKFFIYTLAGSLFMLVAFVYLYQKAGSLLLQDLYQLQLSSREQFWIFLAFFLAYAIKIPLIPFHTWQAKVYQKAPAVGTMLLSGIMLKMGLYSLIRWQLPIAPMAAKTYSLVLIAIGIAGVIYGSILALQQKNLKKLLAYSSLAHVGLIAAGIYTLTLDGFRGAILQMLAHGLVVVGLFFTAEIISRRYQTQTISEMGGIRSQASKFASCFLLLVLASVALPATFNFVGEFTVLYALFQINIWFAVFGGLTIILGAYYMLKMFQNTMLGATNVKYFSDIDNHEKIVLVVIIGLTFFFGLYSKPIIDLITPSLDMILRVIHKN